MKKTLIILRHAHRDTSERSLDNGLDEKGIEQVARLKKFFAENYSVKNPQAFSSPKIRCQETIAAIGKFETMDLLDERDLKENEKEFLARVEKFMDWWKTEAADFCVICSHGDWIPTFLYKAIREPLDLKKAGLIEMNLVSDEIFLKNIFQDAGRK
ncbi:MAG: histidine phosphatase family protein [Deltaproteobacteria bacterium]|nr:histidine phosphatase family protein [Deltaproteobacteria bacterium]